jgi:hypothetical protein
LERYQSCSQRWRFRTLNFAGGTQLENTLEKFRCDLLTRSAEDHARSEVMALVPVLPPFYQYRRKMRATYGHTGATLSK